MRMLTSIHRKIIGWTAVFISAVFTNLWSYWGIIENFHEGWYHTNLWDNISMMLGQYLLVPFTFIILGFISIQRNKIGSILHLAIAILMYFKFGQMNAGLLFISTPIIGLAILYWLGSFHYKSVAYILVVAFPMFIIFIIGSIQLYKVSHRFSDNNFEMRGIKGNAVHLIWAPTGPGWPDNGVSWKEAKKICSYLSEDGKSISNEELNIWRLPTVEEAVSSQVYHGENAVGSWNNKLKKATYYHQPDKESPLWNKNIKTIYWWTSTEVNEQQAYIIVYNGGVHARNKNIKVGYLNFRAVKDPSN